MASPTDRAPSLELPPQRKATKLGRSLSYISSALSTNSRSPKTMMSGTPKPTKTKLTPFERFVQLGRKNTDGSVTFPPPHWSQPGDAGSSTAATNASAPSHELSTDSRVATDIPLRAGSPETILIDREDLVATPTATTKEQDVAQGTEDDGADESADAEPAPEPSYLARKIQALLATLPAASPSQPQTPISENAPPANPEADPSHPSRLPLPAWIADSRLVSYLTSPQVMNGSSANGRPSVWELLDKLKSTTGMSKSSSSTYTDKGKGPAAQPPSDGEGADGDDRASVMLYAPLVPDDTSEVEVARSEVISMFSDQTTIHEHEPEPESKEEMTLRERLASMWPSDGMRIGGHRLPAEHPRETRIWVPSKEKISLEIRWWGYRMYAHLDFQGSLSIDAHRAIVTCRLPCWVCSTTSAWRTRSAQLC